MKNATVLITCPIFEEELNAVLPSDSNVMIHFMDFGIHNNANRMKEELESAIAKAKNINSDISLLVGCECYCDIAIGQIAENANAKYPLMKNCVEIILGPERTKELQKNRTIIFTQGWIKMITKSVEYGVWTEVDARINFGYFDRILILDYGIAPITDLEILSLYDLIQVPIEIEQVKLDYFKDVLYCLLR